MAKARSMFDYEPSLAQDNGYFASVRPDGGDLAFTMSGRCGIYYCLTEIAKTDKRKVAYVPEYTCETVLAPFDKAGYTLKFYSIDRNLHSVFDPAVLDEISVLSLCGYYGFSNYDRSFVEACKARGIVVFEDVTHSLLSADGIDPLCDYAAGSFRKWMGVACGGFAIKRNGKFTTPLLPIDQQHLLDRCAAIETSDSQVFWNGELRLRKMFDRFAGDARSEHIMRHADLNEICHSRRENFSAMQDALSDNLNGVRPVFTQLTDPTVPSHFCLYAEDREHFCNYLAENGISSTIYWPIGPLVHPAAGSDVQYIYDHILSLKCDQRYTPKDMRRTAQVVNAYKGK